MHVLNYAQSLFEELLFGKSDFIFNEYYVDKDEDININENLDSQFTDENEELDVEKQKSLRRCAYGAYLSSLAPKHTKTVQCT